MQELEKILEHYGLVDTLSYPVTEKLYRITDGTNEFALKQSSFTEQSMERFRSLLGLAEEYNIQSFLPVYLTKNNVPCVNRQGRYFYLSPWVPSGRPLSFEDDVQSLYQTIGKIHKETKQTEMITADEVGKIVSYFQSVYDDTGSSLLQVVEQFEKEHFMSPFGLLVCTQFRNIQYILRLCREKAGELVEKAGFDAGWRICLVHGNLQLSHWIDPYFINWEQATFSSPIFDLYTFFTSVSSNQQQNEACLEQFPVYLEESELAEHELQLLSLYLLNPQPYFTVVQTYLNENISTIQAIYHLQEAFRKIMFGLSFQTFIEREYKTTANNEE